MATEKKEINNGIFFGTIMTLCGLVVVGVNSFLKGKIEIEEKVQEAKGPWEQLKNENRALYYECLKSIES